MGNRQLLLRPSVAQVKAIVEFMQKHPALAQNGLRFGPHQGEVHKLWVEVSKILNTIKGANKSTKGWIKFWSDKQRNTAQKQKLLNCRKSVGKLSQLELKILDIEKSRKKKPLRKRLCNVVDNSIQNFLEDNNDLDYQDAVKSKPTEADKKHLNIMEKMIDAMNQQATALAKIAEMTLMKSKAMELIAEASHQQALAVDRLATSFETINTTVYDVRSSILNIDYTTKKCFNTNSIQHNRQNNLFS